MSRARQNGDNKRQHRQKRKKNGNGNGNGKREPFKRLKKLDCFPEVHNMIVGGYGMDALARYIQEEKGQLTDIKHDSLVRQLLRYRDTVPPGEIVKVRNPAEFERMTKNIKRDRDVLERLEWLYDVVHRRIELGLQHEEALSMPMPILENPIREMRVLLMDIHDLKERLGLVGKEPIRMEVDVRDREAEAKDKALIELADELQKMASLRKAKNI